MEHHLGRHFHHHSVVYLNKYQDTLASAGILSTPCLVRTTLLSPFVLEPSFLNMKTVTWACLFFNFHHEMFNGTGGNNYLGASCSFIHDLYLHIVKLKLKFNKKTYGSEYIAEILEDILKTDYNFDFSNNERTVISDRINAATKVT